MKVEIKIVAQCPETTITIVTSEMTDEINELAKRLQSRDVQFLVGSADSTMAIIDVEKIIRVYAANQKVIAVTDGAANSALSNREYVIKLRLYELEDRLPGKQFVRISHSEIINLKKVRDFDLSFTGSIQVRFIDGTTTFVSRRYVSKIKNTLGL
jgi:DNA-binding LytR/AlgR family response regulator